MPYIGLNYVNARQVSDGGSRESYSWRNMLEEKNFGKARPILVGR